MSPRLPPILRDHPVIRSLDAEEIELLGRRSQIRRYPVGSYVFRESQPRRSFGVLLSGRVEIVKGLSGRPEILHVLVPGESFGETTLLDEYPHSTSGVVTEAAEVLEIDRGVTKEIAKTHPVLYGKLAMAAAQVIASRLRHANTRLSGRGVGYLSGELRMEYDLLGERPLSTDLYYGVQTLRAMENFPITGIPIGQYPHLVFALAAVKQAAAQANHELGLLADDVADAIQRATQEILEGRLHEWFVVDVIQGGAGTSTNMNANEVIASRANEIATGKRGGKDPVHPNDHVNMEQ
ncbi:MAG: Aspartate ammonia-lyase, partial [uncultured Gemmatimonadetes bacterium]